MDNFTSFLELEKEIDKAEVEWLKLHHEELWFSVEFEDKGFAFVDVLTITDNRGKEIAVFDFYSEGESDEFINMICA